MSLEITMKINGTESIFTGTENGYFCLDEVWQDFGLKAAQHPLNWLGREGKSLIQTDEIIDLSESGGGTWAGMNALYLYAMWVDIDFFMTVLKAFAALTRGK